MKQVTNNQVKAARDFYNEILIKGAKCKDEQEAYELSCSIAAVEKVLSLLGISP